MGYATNWFHERHWGFSSRCWEHTVLLLKNMWLGVLLVVLGVVAFVTAIILAYPVMAHFAAKFFQ